MLPSLRMLTGQLIRDRSDVVCQVDMQTAALRHNGDTVAVGNFDWFFGVAGELSNRAERAAAPASVAVMGIAP